MKKILGTVLAVAAIAAGCLLAGGCEMQRQDQEQLSYREQIEQEGTAYLAQIGAQDYTAGTVTYVSGTGSNWYCVPMTAQGKEPFNVFVRRTKDTVEIRNDRVLQGLSRQLSARWDKMLPEGAVGRAWVTFYNQLPAQQWNDTETLQTVADAETLDDRWYLLVPQKDAAALQTTAQALADDLGAQGWTGVLYAAAVPQSTIDSLTAAQVPVRAEWSSATAKGMHVFVKPKH